MKTWLGGDGEIYILPSLPSDPHERYHTKRSDAMISIGGSEIGIIHLGSDGYRSRLDLYLRERGLVPRQEATGRDVLRGLHLEQECLDQAADALKATIIGTQVRYEVEHGDLWTARGTPDAIALIDGEKSPIDAKCPRAAKAARCAAGDLPVSWTMQVQWYLGLSGMRTGYLAILNCDDWSVSCHEIKADDALFLAMTRSAEDFVISVRDGIPPVDAIWASPPRPRAPEQVVEPGTPTSELLAELAGVERQIGDLERRKGELRERLMLNWPINEAGEPCKSLIHYSGRVSLLAASERESIDAKALRAKWPEIASQVTKVSVVKPQLRIQWSHTKED